MNNTHASHQNGELPTKKPKLELPTTSSPTESCSQTRQHRILVSKVKKLKQKYNSTMLKLDTTRQNVNLFSSNINAFQFQFLKQPSNHSFSDTNSCRLPNNKLAALLPSASKEFATLPENFDEKTVAKSNEELSKKVESLYEAIQDKRWAIQKYIRQQTRLKRDLSSLSARKISFDDDDSPTGENINKSDRDKIESAIIPNGDIPTDEALRNVKNLSESHLNTIHTKKSEVIALRKRLLENSDTLAASLVPCQSNRLTTEITDEKSPALVSDSNKFNSIFHQLLFVDSMNAELDSQSSTRIVSHLRQYEEILSEARILENDLIRELKDIESQYRRLKRENDRLLVEFNKITTVAATKSPVVNQIQELLVQTQQANSNMKSKLETTRTNLQDMFLKVKSKVEEKEKVEAQKATSKKQQSNKKKELEEAKSLLDSYKTFLKDSRNTGKIKANCQVLIDKINHAELTGNAGKILSRISSTVEKIDKCSTKIENNVVTSDTIDHQNFKLLYNFSEKCAANCSQQQKNTRLEALTKLSEEEKKLLQQHQKQLEDLQANQAMTIQAAEERDKLYNTHNEHLRMQTTFVSMYTGDLKKSQWEAADHISKQILELEQLKNSSKSGISDEINKLYSMIYENERLKESITELSNNLDRHQQEQKRSNSHQVTETDILSAQTKELRKKILCKLCLKNNKDTVLTKCWHVFCSFCVSRQKNKKCPICKIGFTKADIRTVYLEFDS